LKDTRFTGALALQGEISGAQREVPSWLKGNIGEGSTEEEVLKTAGYLGLSEDIAASDLVSKASRGGWGPRGAEVEVAYRQALADAQAFKTVLEKVRCSRFPCVMKLHAVSVILRFCIDSVIDTDMELAPARARGVARLSWLYVHMCMLSPMLP
jgi:hypothetical protein